MTLRTSSLIGCLLLGACAGAPPENPAGQQTERPEALSSSTSPAQQQPASASQSPQQQAAQPTPRQNLNLKHIVHIAATPAWSEALTQQLSNVMVPGRMQHAQFRLQIQAQHKSDTPGQINLSGLLKKKQIQQVTSVNVNLTTRTGDALYQNTYTYAHDPVTTLGGDTRQPQPLPAQARTTFINRIAQAVQPLISQQPWTMPVVSQLDAEHVLINAGPDTRLFPGARLQTTSAPAAALAVATFETSAQGRQNAVLRLTQGLLPAPGRALTPAP